jgi:hypothetical protein
MRRQTSWSTERLLASQEEHNPVVTHAYLISNISNVVVLGGLVVSVLATGPKVRGFNPGRGRWIFKGDKKSVAQLPSEREVKSHVVDLRHVKEPYGHESRCFVSKIQRPFLTEVSWLTARWLWQSYQDE